jgi:hypothetical protein
MTINILRLAMALGLVAGVSACSSWGDPGPRGVGLPFDVRLSEGETARDFSILVQAPGATLAQARESARYEATRHCIELSGFSTVEWTLDPATGDWAVFRTEDGEPIVSGRCAQR